MGAVEARIAESEHWFIGEDRTLVFDVTSDGTTPQTMTGWALTWEMLERRGGNSVLISKTTGAAQITISNGAGTNDRATVAITDVDTEGDGTDNDPPLDPGTYFYVLRRTDAGSESVLAFGDAVLQEASL